jgi:60 kDa SS-A/Ro ribonucleoprotein
MWGRPKWAYPLSISPRQRLDDVVQSISNLPRWNGLRAPMVEALKHRWAVDAFVVYTDSDVGGRHPPGRRSASIGSAWYRGEVGGRRDELERFSIADPDDAGMLDVVGSTRPRRRSLAISFGRCAGCALPVLVAGGWFHDNQQTLELSL